MSSNLNEFLKDAEKLRAMKNARDVKSGAALMTFVFAIVAYISAMVIVGMSFGAKWAWWITFVVAGLLTLATYRFFAAAGGGKHDES